MEDLKSIRNEIDDIDKTLVQLLEKRMHIVYKVAEYKKTNNIPILDKNREIEILNKNISYLNDESLENYLTEIFKTILAESKNYQQDFIKTK